MRQQLLNTIFFLKHELHESARRVRELHAAYLASQHTMDSILRFTALSHPVLSYYMRTMRADHEARKRHQLRRLFEEQNEDIELLLRALRECRANALIDTVGRRKSPRGVEAENRALRAKVARLELYIRRANRRSRD